MKNSIIIIYRFEFDNQNRLVGGLTSYYHASDARGRHCQWHLDNVDQIRLACAQPFC